MDKASAYRRWLRMPEAEAIRYHKPYDYKTLENYPNNFKEVREAFHVYLIIKRMTT